MTTPAVDLGSFELPGFESEGLISGGATSWVYRMRRKGRSCAVKVMKAAPEAAHSMAMRFRREAAALGRLSHPAVVRIVETGEHQGQPFLVMDLVDGQSLADKLQAGPLSQEETVTIARALGQALAEVHQHGLVHRDIKPGNVIIGPKGLPVLIDFGLAANAAEVSDSRRSEVVGTFLYCPPEQSGALKRPVDPRSDLYSLGAMLFECIAGRPPFEGPTVPDLITQHASEVPPDLAAIRPEIGPALSAIVAKLLAKDPDDRYQNAKGLLADLNQLAAFDAAIRAGQAVTLGSETAGYEWSQEYPLVGRERELSALRLAWEKTLKGAGGVLQVEGEGGSGKSRLIRELVQSARRSQVLVLTGKCQKFEAVPFAPIREAVDELLADTERLPDGEREAMLRVIREAAGEFGSIVKRLSRGLVKLFQDAPEAGQLKDAADEQDRFYTKIAEFLCNLATTVPAVLLVVDDVQWLDTGSLEVLRRVAGLATRRRVLVATSARNDLESENAVKAFVRQVGDSLIGRLSLGPLNTAAVRDLVGAYLGQKEIGTSFVERLFTAANGNPFAIGEYLRALLDSGGLYLKEGRWEVHQAQLESLTVSKDVLQLVINRLGMLSAESRSVLNGAVIVGMRFSVSVLTSLMGGDEQRVRRGLNEAAAAHVVEQQPGDRYMFVHDRLVEALLTGMAAGEARDLHQGMAEVLEASSDRSPEAVHALARHFALGHAERHAKKVSITSLAAGRLALDSYGNEEAFELLERALRTARTAEAKNLELMEIEEALAEACTRTGRTVDARNHLERALLRSRDRDDLARIRYLIANALFHEGKAMECWKYIEDALEALGSPLPRSKQLRHVALYWYWLLAAISGRTGFRFGSAAGKRRWRLELIVRIYEIAGPIAYTLGQITLFKVLTIQKIYFAHFLGVTGEYSRAHAWYSYMLGHMLLPEPAHEHGKLAVAVGEQLGNRYAEWLAREHYVFAQKLLGEHDPETDRTHREMFPEIVKWCPPWEVGATMASFIGSMGMRGHSREAGEMYLSNWEDSQKAKNLVMMMVVLGCAYSQLMLMGRKTEALKAKEELARRSGELGYVPWVRAFVYYNEVQVLLDEDDFSLRLEEAIQGFLQTIYETKFEEGWTKFGYGLVAEARLIQYSRSQGRDRRAARAHAVRAFRMYESRAVNPVNRSYLEALRGWLLREDGKLDLATLALRRAEQFARRADSPLAYYLVARERARIAVADNDPMIVRREAGRALEVCLAQGWKNRIERLRAEFKLEGLVPIEVGATGAVTRVQVPSVALTGRLTSHGARTSLGVTAQQSLTGMGMTSLGLNSHRYVQALLQASLASTSTIDPDQQARAALDEMIKLLGAERAFLFLGDTAEGLTLKAARSAGQKDLELLRGYSTTAVRKVAEKREAIVLAGTEEGEALGSESAVAHDLRSIMAAPLQVRERLVGVVYLDSRMAKGLFTKEDVDILTAIANHIAIALETGRTARLEAERREIAKDLALTSAVQSLFLPQVSVVHHHRISIAGFYRPAAQCGGDWWWHAPTPTSGLRIFVGDVTGHGVASAMVTASVASSFQTLERLQTARPLDELLLEMDRGLRQTTGGKFGMSMAAIEVDPWGRRLTWWNTGAPPLFILKPDGTFQFLYNPSTPLGVAENIVPQKVEHELQPGERICIFSDGLVELALESGRQLGMRALAALLSSSKEMPLEEARAHIIERADQLRGKAAQEDDITLVVLDAHTEQGETRLEA